MRNERGAITIITLTTILFMIAFLTSTFVIISNRRQAQIQVKQETQDIYENDIENIDEIYDDYMAQEGENIPISTVEDLLKVGTNEYIVCNEKIYKCTSDANYQLMNNISFSVSDYLSDYSENFSQQTWQETQLQTTSNPATNFSYTGGVQTYTTPAAGKYILQVWGAQGGNVNKRNRRKRRIFIWRSNISSKYKNIRICWRKTIFIYWRI